MTAGDSHQVTRAFLDANVIFSAAHRTGITGRLITQAARRVELVASDGVIEEARRNLSAKRPTWQRGLDDVLNLCTIAPTTLFAIDVAVSENDRAVLCTAIRAHCNWLVTGDRRDFGTLFDQTIDGVEILSTLRFAERLRTCPTRD